jgi:hypothetical protein
MTGTPWTAILAPARIFVWCLGLIAVFWGVTLLPVFWREAPLTALSSELLRGHAFSEQVLLDNARALPPAENSRSCIPADLLDAMMLRLAILDEAIRSKDTKRIAAAYLPAYEATRSALLCAPSDSYSWLNLFWLDATVVNIQPKNANYLRLSYALGPNEGWICLRRNRLAVTAFGHLPADLQNDAIDEFVRLVDTGWAYSDVDDIFEKAPPEFQKRVAIALKSAKPYPRSVFVRTLRDRGVDIKIPGVDTPDHPWQ